MFVWVSLKTRIFVAFAGRPGDVVQYREATGETGRLNMHACCPTFAQPWKALCASRGTQRRVCRMWESFGGRELDSSCWRYLTDGGRQASRRDVTTKW